MGPKECFLKQRVQPGSTLREGDVTRRGFIAGASAAAFLGTIERGGLAQAPGAQQDGVSAAREVLTRLLGNRIHAFELALLPSAEAQPAYAVSARQGRVRVEGSNGVAICRGAYAYLRERCGAMVTWSGKRLDLPERLPDQAREYVVCPNQFVQYMNPCTFGYTTVWWNWERWQQELDWMALHGVTMALALEGQESIWQRVWLNAGVTQAELDHHFTGPAQLPWHRMGNLNNFDGPLQQDWIDSHRVLQHQILAGMRALGIVPIVPGFSGFVPQGYKRVHPETETFTEMWHSSQVPHLSKTFILDPRAPHAYRGISAAFFREYQREFGKARYYLVDTFNELSIPVRNEHRYEDLAQFGESIMEGILAGDPDGVWVMQGWLFRDNPQFWDDASVKAFLSRVPDDRVIVLDYSSDAQAYDPEAAKEPLAGNIWRKDDAFHGKGWLNGMLHTFGGNNNVKGNLALMAVQFAAVRSNARHGRLLGTSMNPEGIENNEVVYELLTDASWASGAIQLEDWLEKYCRVRYGACPQPMQQAWHLLTQSAYAHHTWSTRQAWQSRPRMDPAAQDVDASPIFQKAVEQFLECSGALGQSFYYRNDLIELAVQFAGGSVDARFAKACQAHKEGRHADRDRYFEDGIAVLLQMDALLHVREDRRLERWVAAARAWGKSPDQANYYDLSSRRLLTYWGWPDLNDYASRVWSGLTRDYYAPRWREFARALKVGETPYFDEWEETWLSVPYRPTTPPIITDVPAAARAMLSTCRSWN